MDNQQATQFEIGWIIGIIDGEGSILLGRNHYNNRTRYTPIIQIVNTNKNMMEKAYSTLKKLGIGCWMNTYHRKRSTERPITQLRIAGIKRCKKFLDITKDLFVAKNNQANHLHKYLQFRLSLPSHNVPYDKEGEDTFRLIHGENWKSSETTRVTRLDKYMGIRKQS